MAKKTKAPASAPAASAAKPARGALTPVVRAALTAHPHQEPKEIVGILERQGIVVTAAYVSGIKHQLQKQGWKQTSAPAGAAPVLPEDAVSLALLQKAKRLAAQLGSIQEAKRALDALVQLLD